ncbi:hypothetical protein WV31_01710 [Magnetospirillum sp. ME-1]|nr:hypothetical protein WV31_01710 [Magnetospirillum sp. ME-1]
MLEEIMTITCMGIDLAKSVFQLHGADAEGRQVLGRRVTGANRRDMTQTGPTIDALAQQAILRYACSVFLDSACVGGGSWRTPLR